MTPSELLARCRSELVETSQSFYSDSTLYNFMADGEATIAQRTGCIEGLFTGATVASTRAYNLTDPTMDSTHFQTVDLRVDGVKMKKVTMNDLDVIEGSTASTGTPQFYYEWGVQFFLVPTPTSVLTYNLYFIGTPVALTIGSTSFSIPEYMADPIGDYVLWRALSQDNMLERAAFHRSEWDSGLKNCEAMWARRKRADKDAFVKDIDLYQGNSAGVLRYLF